MLILLLEVLACIAMWIAAVNPSRSTDGRFSFGVNWMCASFALLITAHLVGLPWPR